MADVVAIQVDHPCLQFQGKPVGPFQVTGEDVGGKAVLGVVRLPQGVLFVLKRDGHEDGPEDLLLGDFHVVLPHENRGEEVVPPGEVLPPEGGLGPLPAHEEPRPFLLPRLDVAQDPLEVLGVDQGPHLRLGVQGVAHPDGPGPFRHPPHEVLKDLLLHEEPGACRAPFPVEGEDLEDHGVQGPLQVGVGEDQGGAFAAELRGEALEVVCGVAHDDLPRLRLPGEGEEGDEGVGHQGRPRLLAKALDQVEDPRGEVRLLEDLGKLAGGEGAPLRGLQDHGVPEGQGGGDPPGGEHQGGVPGGDDPHGARGNPDGVVEPVPVHGEGPILHGVLGVLGVEGEVFRRPGHLGPDDP